MRILLILLLLCLPAMAMDVTIVKKDTTKIQYTGKGYTVMCEPGEPGQPGIMFITDKDGNEVFRETYDNLTDVSMISEGKKEILHKKIGVSEVIR